MGRLIAAAVLCIVPLVAGLMLVPQRAPAGAVIPATAVGGTRPTAAPDTSEPDEDLAARVFAPATAPAIVPLLPSQTEPPTLPLTAENLLRGAQLYTRVACGLCHGPRGEGVVGPRIAATARSLLEVRQRIRVPTHALMPAFAPAQLTDDDVAAIYAFLQSLGRD